MIDLVGEHGYADLTVAQLAKRARVSKRDFYKHFSGKEACFLASYDAVVDGLARAISAATEGEDDGRGRLRLGFLAFAAQISVNPKAAQLVLVEVYAVGAVAVERMSRTNRLFEALLAGALAEEGMTLPRLLVKGIVAGCGRVAQARLLAGQPWQPALDGDELAKWALSLCDHEAARLRRLGVAASSRAMTADELPSGEAPPGDERTLILAAMERLVRREGYATLTIQRLRVAAGVSRRSFDTHFEGMEDCFLATLGILSGRALTTAEPSFLSAGTWASGVNRMIGDVARFLARDRSFADIAFREAFSPDLALNRWRSEMIAKLGAMLGREAPPALRPSALASEASIGAMWGVIHHFVTVGRAGRLPTAAPVLSFIALAPVLGGEAAVDAIVAEAGGGLETPSPERLPRSVRS
jgi:AcrR family transcriptional regulator